MNAERLSRQACISACREMVRDLPDQLNTGSTVATQLAQLTTDRAQAAIVKLSRHIGKTLGFGVDTVRALDRFLADNFVLNELNPEEVLGLGFVFAEILRRNFGGDYIWLSDRETLGLKIGPLTALPIDKVLQSLELQKKETLEGYLFIVAKKQHDPGKKPVTEAKPSATTPRLNPSDDEDET